jgi:MFS transporter, DHA3 family, macrolide efflux protein
MKDDKPRPAAPIPGQEISRPDSAQESPETEISHINKSQFLPVLRNAPFMIFSVSQSVSLFGDKLDYMALLAMIAFFSNKFGWESSRAISFLSVIIALPTILFGPLAGILVDRWDRRKVMVVCDSLRTLLVLGIPTVALVTTNLPLIYVLAFMVFLCGLFFNTARLSIIPNLVGQGQLLGANSFMNFIGRIATFAGVLLGGLVVDWSWWRHIGINPTWSAGFYIDSLSYLVSVVALLVIFRQLKRQWGSGDGRKAKPPEVKLFLDQQARMLYEVREAWQLVSKGPTVLFVYASIFVTVVLGAAVFVLYIPIIQGGSSVITHAAGLNLGTRGVGFIAAVGSVGLVLSAMAYGIIGHRVKKHLVIIVCFFVLGSVAAVMAVLKSFVLALPLAFIAGLALSPVYIGMDTLLHESVPEEARGRIFSVREWLLHLTFALSSLIIGQLTNFFPNRHLLFAVGLLIVATSAAGFVFTRGRKLA